MNLVHLTLDDNEQSEAKRPERKICHSKILKKFLNDDEQKAVKRKEEKEWNIDTNHKEYVQMK